MIITILYLVQKICYSIIFRRSNIFFNCNKIMHKSLIILFLLVGSLVMLVPNGTSNMNIISNAIAIELHPSIDGYLLQQQQQMYTNTD
jgi:hypothetical protein